MVVEGSGCKEMEEVEVFKYLGVWFDRWKCAVEEDG